MLSTDCLVYPCVTFTATRAYITGLEKIYSDQWSMCFQQAPISVSEQPTSSITERLPQEALCLIIPFLVHLSFIT